jgi:SpoVK/Ycf46/Vps4 family AAA+-type ATPase
MASHLISALQDLEPNFNFAEVAAMTEGYSGSDLKNLCVAAAHRPIRELLLREKVAALLRNSFAHALIDLAQKEGKQTPENEVVVRALSVEDFKKAKLVS